MNILNAPAITGTLEMEVPVDFDTNQSDIDNIMDAACKDFNTRVMIAKFADRAGIRGEINPSFKTLQHAYMLIDPVRYTTINAPTANGICVSNIAWDTATKTLRVKYLLSKTIMDTIAKYGSNSFVYKPRAIVHTLGRSTIVKCVIITIDAYMCSYASLCSDVNTIRYV